MLPRNYDFSKVTLTIEVCKACNVYCENCFLAYENRLRDRRLFKKEWVTKLAESRIFQKCEDLYVSILGGELSIVDQDYLEDLVNHIKTLWPDCSFSMVSNFFNSKPRFLDLYLKHSDVVETTFDFGRQNLNRNRDVFLASFRQYIEELARRGADLNIDINFVMNRQSLEYGVDAALDYFSSFSLPEGGRLLLKFDHGIDFVTFRAQGMPHDRRSGMPMFPLDLGYGDYAAFVAEFRRKRDARDLSWIVVPQIDFADQRPDDRFFFTKGSGRVISLSSDGFVTTNPVFTEIPSTFLGNIADMKLDECLGSDRYFLAYSREQRRAMECSSCEYFERCEGGSLFLPKHLGGDTSECAGIKSFFRLQEAEGITHRSPTRYAPTTVGGEG
ncbi:4Fe-4S cluster-binding domain-containing protein [Pararhizobium sp. BT-229]|uniref:4Fe-4S cluster-binding domain-containing protein n=1 Tax=Pararhizobium sp. BT-229 TaxID=2986923 RepID=UPI0021F7D7FC|nr:4Fe-4S cluster-binding domain-containing protein [Pararhizobium sp. BT-229]MCV9964153.1 4Fe-4S cluster-binding domain-containing protein [Pararhizobium sp. BT-229]